MPLFIKHNTATTGLILHSGNPSDVEVSIRKPFIGTYDETSNVLTPMITMDTSSALKTSVYGQLFKTDAVAFGSTAATEVLNK